jgi:hypothetical protein
MINTKSVHQCNELFEKAYKHFKALDKKDISKISNVNNYEQYSAKCNGLNTVKGMPSHVKSAYFHDLIIKQLGLESKYEIFHSGDKVRSLYVKTPNKYNIGCIAYKTSYPTEFEELFKIDYEKMFDKLMYAAIERFYIAVGWNLRKPNENVVTELMDLLGED